MDKMKKLKETIDHQGEIIRQLKDLVAYLEKRLKIAEAKNEN